ncbi:MAG: HAD-IA family hydrolase [Gemmatimonadota bacterium]|nr:MAG: HAD-IA family hydrolase [Gemmatimonadota bacterium]
MARFDAFLFDLDGTLIDSIDLIFASYRHTLSQHHGSAPPDEVWLAGLGTPLRQQLRPFARNQDEVEAMVATYRDFNFAHHDAMVRPFPGTRAAVEQLKARGLGLAVVTSKARNGLQRGLNVCGLDDLFEVVVAADDVTLHKPDPAPVLHALDFLGVEAGRSVFVGDSPHDMEAGRRAGTRTAAALWGPFSREQLADHSPDFWLTRTAEVVDLA